jgi:hypothetical protein
MMRSVRIISEAFTNCALPAITGVYGVELQPIAISAELACLVKVFAADVAAESEVARNKNEMTNR